MNTSSHAAVAAAERDDNAAFVEHGSIVRRIWGDADMVLLVFAGSAAEFALNRAVDWLFFTGELPRDPIGRLFSTAGYSQHIVFADVATATRTLDRIRMVHEAVERERGDRIPDWAHRDVLYMLIDYSERAHELLVGRLTADEQRELYAVFRRVGTGLGIPDLPQTYAAWRADRERHLRRDLVNSAGTKALYARYREHLGWWRYQLLLRVQAMLAPDHVRGLLELDTAQSLRSLARFYPVLVRAGLRPFIRRLLMPAEYLPAVQRLDHAAPRRPASRRTAHGRAIGFARRLARTALLAVAACAGASAPAAGQGLSLPGDWVGYLGFGASMIDTQELHDRLAAGGYPSFDRTAPGMSIGAYATLRSGLMLGGEGHFLDVGHDTHEGRAMGLGAGYATLGAGYAVDVSPRTRVYPRLGLGVGGFGLWMETAGDTVAFDDVLSDPARQPEPGRSSFMTLSRDNMVVDVGAGAEFLPGGRGFGPLIGVRLGYVFAPFTTSWHMKGSELSGGPAASVAGPYVRLVLGAARRR